MLHQESCELFFFLVFFSGSSQFCRCLLLQWNRASLNAIWNPAALFVQPWAAFLPFFAWALLLKGLLNPATWQRCLGELMWPVILTITNTQNQELCWNLAPVRLEKQLWSLFNIVAEPPKFYVPIVPCTVGWVWLSFTQCICAQTCQWHDLCL